jgi:uncharacterized membrane protein
VAFSGTVISICLTGILAYFSIKILNLTGFFSDETVYLNFGTGGTLDFEGLLLGGIIIGVLGVLDDVAITQVAVVSEIKNSVEKIKPINDCLPVICNNCGFITYNPQPKKLIETL